MTGYFTEYDPSTGKIGAIFSIREDEVEFQILPPGNILIPGKYEYKNQYIKETATGPDVLPRPVMTPRWNNTPLKADGIDVTLLLDLPDPCTVTFSGPGLCLEGEVIGGIAEFTTDVAGEHKVLVRAFPYLDYEETLDAI
jgi:hypothetical protein